VSALTDEIGDHPVFLAQLNPFELESQQFAAAQPTAKEHREHRVITELAQRGRWPSRRQQSPSLLRREPVPQTNPKSAHALDPSDAGGELRTEQPGIGRFIGHSAHRRESQVDRGRSKVSLFEVDPIAEHDGAVERQARFRAIPRDELPDGMVVRALAGRGQAIKYGRLRLVRIVSGIWRNTLAGAAGAARLVPVPATSSRP
jgi:hypothetical protein